MQICIPYFRKFIQFVEITETEYVVWGVERVLANVDAVPGNP